MPYPTLTEQKLQRAIRRAVRIWTEDDSGCPDAERIGAALRRFWPHQNFDSRAPDYVVEEEDGTNRVYHYGSILIIVWASCPTNSAIYVANIPE